MPEPTNLPPTPESAVTSNESYAPSTRQTLLQLARTALVRAVEQGARLQLPPDLEPLLREKKGCFVTLTKQGRLRGCIGTIDPELPLGEAVVMNAYRAAVNDPRFAPVSPDELASIEVEVSVLTIPKRLHYQGAEELLSRLRPHVDGVVLKIGSRRATFLPQVWEKLPTSIEFLDQLAQKAGLAATAWRGPDAEVFVYQAESFTEANTPETRAP